MNEQQVATMVEALIKQADYDLWKNLYFNPDEPEACAVLIIDLNQLAHEHIDQARR